MVITKQKPFEEISGLYEIHIMAVVGEKVDPIVVDKAGLVRRPVV